MRELRIALIALVATSGFVLLGCDGDDPTDAGPGVEIDASPQDSGSTDGGMDVDAGPPAGSGCGPVGGPCMINPANAAAACPPNMGGMAQGCLLQGGGGNPWMTACFPAGVVPENGMCDPTMAGQCGAGFQCFGDPGAAQCRRHCCTTNDCTAGDRCVLLSMAGPSGSEAGTCQTPVTCDPLNRMTDGSNGCPNGQACFTVGDSLGCFGPGTLTEGDACMTLDACMPGHGCYGTMAGATFCRELCNPMTMPTTCPMNYTCVGLTGFTELGFCNPMM